MAANKAAQKKGKRSKIRGAGPKGKGSVPGAPSFGMVLFIRLLLVALLVCFVAWKIKERNKRPPPAPAPIPPTSMDGPSGPYIGQDFSFTFGGIKTKRGFTGWADAPKKDETIAGGPMKIHGISYKSGIGTHAPSEIVFALDGKVSRFSCLAGMDESGGGTAEVKFIIKLDNKKVFESKVMRRENEPLPIKLDVRGGKELSLILDPNGDNDWDHGDWVNLRFER